MSKIQGSFCGGGRVNGQGALKMKSRAVVQVAVLHWHQVDYVTKCHTTQVGFSQVCRRHV